MSFLKSVIDISHVDFSLYDLKNHALIYSSGLAAKILGYSKKEMEEFTEDYNRKIIHPEDISLVESKLEKLMNSKEGELIETVVRYKRKDGRYIWGYTRKVVSERDKDGKPIKITTVAQDISELVAIQAELEMRVEQLEKISYRNAHDLRGPVASILGLTNIMLEEDIIGEYHSEILNHLCKTVVKLDTVVSELVVSSQNGA